MKTLAVTFDRHPREVANKPQLLSTLDEKVRLLSLTGLDALVVLHFDSTMAALSARQFMADVLRDHLHTRILLTGYDNRFGHGRTETFADYERYGRELGMTVVAAAKAPPRQTPLPDKRPTTGQEEVTFSSSLVRQLLTSGDVAGAAECLGRYYSICGQVVHGEHNGHDLGFPTANLEVGDPMKLIPATGCYAVLADGSRHHAMTNIGTRPTSHGQRLTLETNIFDETGDLYGQSLTIEFVDRLRDEQPFSSPEALAAQLAHDKAKATSILHHLRG